MRNSGRAAAAVSDVAIAAMSAPPGVDALQVTLECLREVTSADTGGFYIHERQGMTIALNLAPDEIWDRVPFRKLPTSLAVSTHPGVRHLLRPTTVQPFSLNDLVSQRWWLNSELGSSMRAEWGYSYQLSIPVPAARSSAASWTWVVGRELRDFSLSDRNVADAVQPVLAVVARHHGMASSLAPSPAAVATTLTQRELVVLRLLVEGTTTKGAAHRLGVSPRTVHKHAERIYRKLGARDRYTAVSAANALGLFSELRSRPTPQTEGAT